MAVPRYKEGIPLLETFEDDDDGPWVEQHTTPGACRSKLRPILIVAACVTGVLLLVGLAIGLPLALALGKSGGQHSGEPVAGPFVGCTVSVSAHSFVPVTLSETSEQRVPSAEKTAFTPCVQPSSAQTFTTTTTKSDLTDVLVPSPEAFHPTPTTTGPGTARETPTPPPVSAQVPTSSSPLPTPLSPSLQQACQCQSPRDSRNYTVLSLPNGLRALLVSDVDGNVSAASMDVAVGSFSDPRSTEGLAHFCEHMLFLGTSKYPKEGEYSGYLSSHGGYDNAFTFTQETNYYFAVDSSYLEEALDRFAQFFVSPLFRSDAVSREIHAVNAEHEKNLLSDEWRAWQLLKHVSNPGHPFSMFSTGSLQTLNHSNILNTLVGFYDRYYTANQMQLVVYGREPTPILSSWVTKYFSDIKTTPIATPETFNSTSFPPPTYTGTIVYFRSMTDTPRLHLVWQTPPLQDSYRMGVASFLSNLLGTESAGGLADALKRQRWVTHLEAGTLLDTDSYTLFQMTVDLTTFGLSHVPDVVAAVFKYCQLLASLNGDQLRYLWNDHVNIAQIKFDYSPKSKPGDYVVNIAKHMRFVKDSEDFLGNPRRLLFNATLLAHTLSFIVPNNTVLVVGAQTSNSSTNGSKLEPHPQLPWPALSQVEPVYGTQYEKIPIPGYLLEYWESGSCDVLLQVPGPNEFIPSDLSIQAASENTSSVPVVVEDLEHVQPSVSTWWLQDIEFREPRVNLHCNLWTSTREVSLRWTVLTTLYTSLVKAVFLPYTYAAQLTEHTFVVEPSNNGLHLQFNLFSDSGVAGRFVDLVIGGLSNATLLNDPVAFSLSKEAFIQNLINYNYTEPPYLYTIRHIQRVTMERPRWENWQLLQEAQRTTLGDVLDHVVNSLLQNVSLLCFSHGNVQYQQALKYTRVVAKLPLSWANLASKGHPTKTEVRLSPGNYSITIAALNPEDRNSVLNIVYQSDSVCFVGSNQRCSQDSLMTRVYLGLLEQMIADLCFQQLRTVEQLGYVVKCFSTAHETTGSFQILIQSAEYSPQRLLGSADSFLRSFMDTYLQNLLRENSTFSLHVGVLRAKLLQKDLSLGDKTSRLWNQIETGMEQFDWNQQTVDVLDRVSAPTLVEFYRQLVVDAAEYKKLAIVVYGLGRSGDLSVFNFTHSLDYWTLDRNRTVLP